MSTWQLGDAVRFPKMNGCRQLLWPSIRGRITRIHTNPYNQVTTLTIVTDDGLRYWRLADDKNVTLIETCELAASELHKAIKETN
jgi:hypothetical protein